MSKYYQVYSNDSLQHSKGAWKNHKYLSKIGGKYIYAVKSSLAARKRLQDAKSEENEANIRRAISGTSNYGRVNASRYKREELQRQYDRTALGRLEKKFRGFRLRPKQQHKVNFSYSTSTPSTGLSANSNTYEVNKKKKKK